MPPKSDCPQCQAMLNRSKALPVVQHVTCPSCGARLTLGGGQGGGQRGSGQADGGQRVGNRMTLLLILLGTVVFLGGGVALAIYCFNATTTDDPSQHTQADPKKGTQDDPNKGNSSDDPGKENEESGTKNRDGKGKSKKKRERLSNQQQLQVNEAIKLGVAYLRHLQEPDGSWKATGDTLPQFQAAITALVGLTLLECDVSKSDPAVQKAADYLRKAEASGAKLYQTYDLSLMILFFDRLDAPKDNDLIRQFALRLVGGQTPSGGWAYNCPIFGDADALVLYNLLEKSKSDVTANLTTGRLGLKVMDAERLKREANGNLPDALKSLNVWRNEAVMSQVESDNSNTQFAILAMWVAKSRGLPVERSLALLVQRFHESQNPNGSWGYEIAGNRKATTGDNQTPTTMTCAGLLGLAVGQGLVNEARGNTIKGRKLAAQQDPAIQRGLDYLGKYVNDPHTPWRNASGIRMDNLYYLWSLERMGVIFNLDKIGGKDWYGWGAEMLIAHQIQDGDKGRWEGGNYYAQHPTINTCLALLFLKRANLARDLTHRLQVED